MKKEKILDVLIYAGAIAVLVAAWFINKQIALEMKWWELALSAIGFLCGYVLFLFLILMGYMLYTHKE